MWPDKTVPVAEAEIDFKYDWAICREGDRTVSHGPSVTYKGNGIGWSYNNPNNVIENIIELKRPMTWEEEKEYSKSLYEKDENKKANQLNIYGLFNDCYVQGEHQMYNGWIGYDFYDMCNHLNEEGWTLVGIAQPPWNWNFEDACVAVIAETIDGDKFWCHAHKSWIDDMRDCMRTDYEKMLKEAK